MQQIRNLTNKAIKKPVDEPLNILTCFYDGVFDVELAKTGHNFYGAINDSSNEWCPIDDIPSNMFFLPGTQHFQHYDFILCNNRIEKWDLATRLQNYMQLPIVTIDHYGNPPNVPDIKVQQIKDRTKSVMSFATNKAAMHWDDQSIYMRPGIEYREPVDKDIDVLLVGHFPPEEHSLLHRLKLKMPGLVIVGQNEDLSPWHTGEELRSIYDRAKIFINLPRTTGLPTLLMPAIESGCAIISVRNEGSRQLLQDATLFLEHVEDIPNVVNRLLRNPHELKKYQQAILEHEGFQNKQKSIEQWSTLLTQARTEILVK